MLGFTSFGQCTINGKDTTSIKNYNLCNVEKGGTGYTVFNGQLSMVEVEYAHNQNVVDTLTSKVVISALNIASSNAPFQCENRSTWKPQTIKYLISKNELYVYIKGEAANGYGNYLPLTVVVSFDISKLLSGVSSSDSKTGVIAY